MLFLHYTVPFLCFFHVLCFLLCSCSFAFCLWSLFSTQGFVCVEWGEGSLWWCQLTPGIATPHLVHSVSHSPSLSSLSAVSLGPCTVLVGMDLFVLWKEAELSSLSFNSLLLTLLMVITYCLSLVCIFCLCSLFSGSGLCLVWRGGEVLLSSVTSRQRYSLCPKCWF